MGTLRKQRLIRARSRDRVVLGNFESCLKVNQVFCDGLNFVNPPPKVPNHKFPEPSSVIDTMLEEFSLFAELLILL